MCLSGQVPLHVGSENWPETLRPSRTLLWSSRAASLEGIECPPTNLEAVAPSLNILRFEAEPLPISGELRREAGGFVVVYSSYLSMARRNSQLRANRSCNI